MSPIVSGDFNFPHSDWSSMHSTNKRELEFLEYLNSLELLPLITTGQTHRSGNILDNIVTSDNLITGYSIENNSSSHHSSIIFNYSSEFNKSYQHPSEYLFSDNIDILNFHNSLEYFVLLHILREVKRERVLFVRFVEFKYLFSYHKEIREQQPSLL